jgi:hypothetical protein
VAASGGSNSSSSSGDEVTMQFVLEKKFAGEQVIAQQHTMGVFDCSTMLLPVHERLNCDVGPTCNAAPYVQGQDSCRPVCIPM